MVFFFNDTATTEIYALSLHDALPIFTARSAIELKVLVSERMKPLRVEGTETHQIGVPWHYGQDRKSTRLNSSHANISYAVFCLKKKNLIPKRYLCLPYSSYPFRSRYS